MTGDNKKKEFGSAVKRERERLGLPPEMLAERAGIQRRHLMDFERGLGKLSLSLETLYNLANNLGISLEELLARAESSSQQRPSGSIAPDEARPFLRVVKENWVLISKIDCLRTLPETELIESINKGLPMSFAEELTSRMQISREEIWRLLRLPSGVDCKALGFAESGRLWELARIFFLAAEVLGGEKAAVQWFKSPIEAIGGQKPISYAETPLGLHQLESILGRIKHGVFS